VARVENGLLAQGQSDESGRNRRLFRRGGKLEMHHLELRHFRVRRWSDAPTVRFVRRSRVFGRHARFLPRGLEGPAQVVDGRAGRVHSKDDELGRLVGARFEEQGRSLCKGNRRANVWHNWHVLGKLSRRQAVGKG